MSNQSINQCLLLQQQPIGFSKQVRLFNRATVLATKTGWRDNNNRKFPIHIAATIRKMWYGDRDKQGAD